MHCAQKEFGTATFMDQFALIDAIHAIERTKKKFLNREYYELKRIDANEKHQDEERERENILYTTCKCCKKF